MRVVQNKPHATDKPADAKPAEPVEDKDEAAGEDVEETNSDDDKKPKLMLSGAQVKEKVDFPPQAIKSFHEKPVAQKQKHTTHVNVPNITQVHQPRSGNH